MNSIALQALGVLTNMYVTPEIGKEIQDKCGKMIGQLLAMIDKDIELSWKNNYSSLIS